MKTIIYRLWNRFPWVIVCINLLDLLIVLISLVLWKPLSSGYENVADCCSSAPGSCSSYHDAYFNGFIEFVDPIGFYWSLWFHWFDGLHWFIGFIDFIDSRDLIDLMVLLVYPFYWFTYLFILFTSINSTGFHCS